MSASVRIGEIEVGHGLPCFIIAEIGINHNGDLGLAKQLIEAAAEANCQLVKFQKRTVGVVYTREELNKPRETPFGLTNGELKYGLEFGYEEYKEIDELCKELGLLWTASCWDEASLEFLEQFSPPCYKIASASLTHDALLRKYRATGRPLILSTGMSTPEQVDHAIEQIGTTNLILLHCVSSYPAETHELNLRMIKTLQARYNAPVGYSGHEVGLATSIAAVSLGACVLERHLTLDRAMWGSDQAASIEPQGFIRLVRDIRSVEEALGDGQKKVYASELPIQKKLRWHEREGK